MEPPQNQEAGWAGRSEASDGSGGNLEVDGDCSMYYEVIYEPFFTNKSHPVGQFCYDPPNQSLTMINKNIALHRRCLLIGYTNKKDKKEDKRKCIIGQFGVCYCMYVCCPCMYQLSMFNSSSLLMCVAETI